MDNNKNNAEFEKESNIVSGSDETSIDENSNVENSNESSCGCAEIAESGNDIQGKKKDKKPKKKMTKKKKIIIIVSVVLVIALIGGAIGGVLAWLLKPTPSSELSRDKLTLEPPVYYVGTANAKPSGIPSNTTEVMGAWNVTTYDDMVAKIKEGKDVVVHAKEFTMTTEIGTITLKSNLYANGLLLDAEAVGKAGSAAIVIPANEERILVSDLYVTGKKELDKDDTIKTFNNYSAMIHIKGDDNNNTAKARLKHCFLENGHKVLHIESAADVEVEGCIIRNAADTTVSIGTFANAKNKVYMKNNVIASSLTSGVNVYCYSNDINAGNADTAWGEVIFDGFLDVYNWKSTNNLAFIPDSEGEFIASIANNVAGMEIRPLDKNTEFKVTLEEENPDFDPNEKESNKNPKMVKNQYIHLAITKIATAKNISTNDTVIRFINDTVKDRNQLQEAKLPLPDAAKIIIKEGYAWGYFNNNNGQVKIHDTITSNKNIFKELVNGRKY